LVWVGILSAPRGVSQRAYAADHPRRLFPGRNNTQNPPIRYARFLDGRRTGWKSIVKGEVAARHPLRDAAGSVEGGDSNPEKILAFSEKFSVYSKCYMFVTNIENADFNICLVLVELSQNVNLLQVFPSIKV
jgi:hypothetical protein